ncbi:ankyrin repeat domain-containing protein 31-like isoform X2 [Heterodontus francisci]|uniref:ankyrin repeat domain-containing protein 31-like isoform X2 n=1 Tax=Heterodontus francisci TaxID=7792 RepID=UPI00355BD1EE
MNGILPLHDALSGSHYEAVKLLLQYGADPKQKNADGKSAFDELVDDKIKDLLETHCNTEVTVHEQQQPGQQTLDHPEDEEQAESITEDSNVSHDLITSPSNDNCTSCDDEQTLSTLQSAEDSENPHHLSLLNPAETS